MRLKWPPSENLLHHARAALAVGSVVTLLHAAGALAWLDALMWRIAAGAGPLVQQKVDPKAPPPAVLVIGAPLYETAFAQASPLSTAKLARLLDTIAAHGNPGPARLVVDLDLSPGPAEAPADPGRQALDASVRRLVEAGGTLVLPLPIRVVTPELQLRKLQWLRSVCALNQAERTGRVVFGLAQVTTHQGVVTQFDANLPTLGVLAARPADRLRVCERAQATTGNWQAALLGTAFDDRALLAKGDSGAWRPYNLRLFGPAAPVGVLDSLDRLPAEAGALAGRVVFVGGAYNPQDRFVVPLEGNSRPVEGVMVHAAAFDSLARPVATVSGLAAFALDVLTGVLLGYAFAASWGWHRRIEARCRGAHTLGAHWAPRLSLLLNFAGALALAVVFLVVARLFLFPLDLWVNPGPMVIGVFAKFALGSGSDPHHGDAHHANTDAPTRLLGLDRAALALLVLAAVASILAHH